MNNDYETKELLREIKKEIKDSRFIIHLYFWMYLSFMFSTTVAILKVLKNGL